jgi:uncharacterized protein
VSPQAAANAGTVNTSEYAPRIADGELDRLLETAPAITIEGALGVGKTATATRRADTVHALEDPKQLSAAQDQPRRLCAGAGTVLIDEWVYVPEVWDLVRRAVAGGSQPGRFLLASSRMPNWLSEQIDDVAIPGIRMRPLALAERGLDAPSVSLRGLLEDDRGPLSGATGLGRADYAREIVVSGLPGLRGLSETRARAKLGEYLGHLIDRELPARGRWVHDPESLRLWLTAYASASSLATSFEAVHDAATGGQTKRRLRALANAYRIVLERLWILDPVEPWAPAQVGSGGRRMEPKHQLADPAFAALLLGLDAERLTAPPSTGRGSPRGRPREPLRDETLPASLFESLVTLSVRVYAQAAGAQVSHLCGSADWPDVELIVEGEDERVVAIAVATDEEAEDRRARALLRTAELLEDTLADAVVITAGQKACRRGDGVAAVPAVLLGP